MSGFSAVIPAAQMNDANAELEALGWGPGNFSVPAFAGASPTHATFHAWNDPAFEAAVAAIPGVIMQEGLSTPYETVNTACASVGATWSQAALPLTGIVTPGLYYYMREDVKEYWWVVQQYDTNTWPDPAAPGLQALVVPARMPGEITEWVQPFNASTAYFLVNAFTNAPDEVTHNGQTWVVSQADGAGNNIWEPGVFGWILKT
jgi:hypothetical protein